MLRHLRARRHEPGDRHRQRLDGLGAHSGDNRPGRDLARRPRRLPGGGHHRYHAPDNQAQLARAPRGGPGGTIRRRSTSPAAGGPGRSSSTCRATSFIQEVEFEYPEEIDLPGFRPTVEGHPAQIKKAAQLIAESERPLILAGHGVRISRSLRRAAGAGREGADTGHHDSPRHQQLPRLASALHGDAGDARDVLEQHRHQRG